MNYHNITTYDMLNGDGLRVVLWVAGCTHHCKGCQNPLTWDENGGLEFNKFAREEIFDNLAKPEHSGITFSGGDPLHPCNISEVTKLAKEIKEKYPNKTIWLYTGFLWENVKEWEIANYLDVLVDGRYEEENRDISIPWRGSTNQRVINVQASLKNQRVVMHELADFS